MSDLEFTRRGIIATSAAAGSAALVATAMTQSAEAAPARTAMAAGAGPVAPPNEQPGAAGELHQIAAEPGDVLTTNQGLPISDDQNSLKVGARGPVLLEDFILREKINHFDHERIPERVVHARGMAAHG